jgi:hypothetical protein
VIVTEDKFWSRVRKTDDEKSCWLWVGGWTDEDGRGRYRLNGRTMIASRAALILSKGPPAEGQDLHACHECDCPGCCRPEHLFWGTREQNMRDMARKGRAGIQQHPERYRRSRKETTKYRPVKQSATPKGVDHRTWTRLATQEEIAIAKRSLEDLGREWNRIALVPAPDPHFDGHKIRVIERRNPGWYIEFGKRYWKGLRQFSLKRARVIKALERVVGGRVRGNGYERELLEFLNGFKVC